VYAFEKWREWQPREAVEELQLCPALHCGADRFEEYCYSFSPERLAAGLTDPAAESVLSQARRQWGRVQLAIAQEWHQNCWQKSCDKGKKDWKAKLASARKVKQPDNRGHR
jgi:hypothetical protein